MGILGTPEGENTFQRGIQFRIVFQSHRDPGVASRSCSSLLAVYYLHIGNVDLRKKYLTRPQSMQVLKLDPKSLRSASLSFSLTLMQFSKVRLHFLGTASIWNRLVFSLVVSSPPPPPDTFTQPLWMPFVGHILQGTYIFLDRPLPSEILANEYR